MGTIDQLVTLAAERKTRNVQAEQATRALRDAVIAAASEGVNEVRLSRLAGVSRPTVRAWLGK